MAMPITVLMRVTASAPASVAAAAISVRSVTLGLSLAHSGRLPSSPCLAAATTSAVAVAEWANMRRRSSTLGQLTLHSTATTWLGRSASSLAALA